MNKKNSTILILAIAIASFMSWKFFSAQVTEKSSAQNTQALAEAERFINAFYSWQPAPLNQLLSNTEGKKTLLYYQAWAETGDYKVLQREPCWQAVSNKIYCAITVSDNIGLALGYTATDTFIISIDNNKITAVDLEANDPLVFMQLLVWMKLTNENNFNEVCRGMFDDGNQPRQCIQAVVASAREFNQ